MEESFINPKGTSFDDLMNRSGVFYCIPEYQRSFSWKKNNIKRLFESASEGLNRLISSDNKEIFRSGHFLGAFVCFQEAWDRYFSFIPGEGKNPDTILNVIDGQQRLTVLTLLCAEIHNRLRVQHGNKKIGDGWLKEQIEANVKELECILGHPKDERVRIIRAHDDKWGIKYKSSLAKFLNDYYKFNEIGSKELFDYTFEDKLFQDAMSYIKKELDNIGRSKEIDMPLLDKLFDPGASNNSAVMEALFGSKPDSVRHNQQEDYVLWKGTDSDRDEIVTLNNMSGNDNFKEEIKRVLLLLFLVRYVYKKMVFIRTVVRGDIAYAFDIFESLNTTGLLLNAFETFRPEVIKRLKRVPQDSPSQKTTREYLDKIGEFLGADESTESKSQNLIISFALAESAEKRLPDQRAYLRRRYSKLHDDDAEGFVKRMLDTAQIHQHFWSSEVKLDEILSYGSNSGIRRHLDEASFCLHYLSSAKHDLVRALIARFYSFHELDKLGDLDNEAKKTKIIDFCEVIKSTAAFFTLWMTLRPQADTIDALHRKIMSGIKDLCPGYCYSKQANLSSKELKRIYRDFLTRTDKATHQKIVIDGKDDWINKSYSMPFYIMEKKRALAKGILMIANHRTAQQNGDKTRLERPYRGADATETVRKDSWQESQYESIEHIYPQNPDNDPDPLPPLITGRLGNLTLLPQIDNLILSNLSWPKKRLICTVLSATSDSERGEAIDKLKNSEEFDEDKIEILCQKIPTDRCLPLTKTLTHYKEFGKDEIAERGKHLLGLAWDILAVEWLGWEK